MRLLLFLFVLSMLWILIAPGCMTFRKSDSEMKTRFSKKNVSLRTQTVSIEGHNLHYAETGDAASPTIIFVHGTPGSWDAFADYMMDVQLLSKYRMISIDRPGFGYSDFGKSENLQKQSLLLSPLLKKLSNGKPCYLAGHSLGGPLVVRLAADNPTLISGLIMISASVDPSLEKPEKWRPVLFNTPLNLFVPGAFKPSNLELWYLKKDLVTLKPAYAAIHCPVYFIHGDKDTWVPPSNVSYATKLLKNTTIYTVMLPGGNHFIPWTKFSEIKTVLMNLDRL